MAKKQKKDTRTIKALGILVLVIAAVCIGLTLGKGASKPKSNEKNDENNNVVNQESTDEPKNSVDTGVENGTDTDSNQKLDEKEKTDEKVKSETQETETTDEKEENIQKENTEVAKDDTDTEKETPQGSSNGDNFDMNVDTADLSNARDGWSFRVNDEHKQPEGYNKFDIGQYDAYYVADTDEKVIYLTFDEGYENGYTAKILDTLKENDVKATFFVTKPYIKKNVDLCKRMKEEGHIVGNHSVNHKRMHELTDDKIKYEIEETARYFEEMTGYKMDTFFRPPEGEYSERTLYLTRKLGYKTMFWSMAHRDWEVDNQPSVETTYEYVTNHTHPGMIALLHAVSSSNTEALDSILKTIKDQGYRFGNLYEVE
ncbi:delta-lactam-biosynthetic de-N-acetylase [Vallitalea longa]|uniref:Delta-lactam-biosynthetic de-N-acetylase n=1 Tax=Vallitalea longa TaxID=2936439 RepID=A0A9W6DHV4_9FIRM|nr:delta-lactam-biosynthetic de-N-acetylase [Vallitalea longa]GKX31848.1 delta-lactam-biosynthetic de-N-acetylase [Vallitalea longa]